MLIKVWKIYFETKILIPKIYNTINQWDTIFAVPRQEQGERQGVIKAITPYGVMKNSAHAHSVLIQNGQFRARIARKECSHFNEVRKKFICIILIKIIRNILEFIF